MPRLILLAFLLIPVPAHAHGGAHPADPGAPAWTFDPWIIAPLFLTVAIYAVGFARLGARRSLWRGAALFLSGWFVLGLSLVSPLHAAGERSFTLHMIEHEMIMAVAALLLPLSQPLAVLLWGLPRRWRGTVGRFFKALDRALPPMLATGLQAIALLVWHAPPLFNRALGHAAWHAAQHLSFLLTALLFWWAVLRTPHRGVAALCLFATSIIGAGLGALMALSSSPWYAGYAAMTLMPFGLTPQEDQALAGLIMWVPGGLVHVAAALLLLRSYLAVDRPSSIAGV
jgi:putative membrane protein